MQNKEPSNNDNIDNNIQDDEQNLKVPSVVQNKNASKTLIGLSIILIIITENITYKKCSQGDQRYF